MGKAKNKPELEQKSQFLLRSGGLAEGNDKLSPKSRRRLIEEAKAENTLKAYSADWRDFADWCAAHEVRALPATPETIVNYLNDLADVAKANTVARRVIAISANHVAAGYDYDANPAKSALVRTTMAAIRREKGTFQRGKQPILLETLQLLLQEFKDADDLRHKRDRAIILLGFAGAFRRSELAAIKVEDLTFSPQGLLIFIPRAKSDQSGKGATIAVPFAPQREYCAVRAVRAWLDAAEIKAGALFRGFKRNGEIRENGMCDKLVAEVIKHYVREAGLDPADFSGHSLRRGFATTAAQHEVGTLGIMRQTRHKSEKMVHRYIAEGNQFRNNPLDTIFGKHN